ncbi:MAG TPA: NAD-dependent epimerase/dehydratase family protein [Longimicrobiales bacterium]|nr:NAD-dependent epimerase/dehydratase family protein [Longimicrobiales bacterium]
MPTRRQFLATTAAAGVGAAMTGCDTPDSLPALRAGSRRAPAVERASRPLDLLILGGTGFIGPHEVEYALERGHRVTLFNRGRTGPGLFPTVETLTGDRAEDDYSPLAGRRWDAVIDNSANVATWVSGSAAALRDATDRYLFVSSLSAHSDNSIVGMGEDGPVFTREQYREAMASGGGGGAAFGPNKAEAERITMEVFGDRGLVVRPGLIVGPGDRSDRFTYWPVRIDRGGEVAAPGDGTDGVQIVDARDLARFMIHLLEAEASGFYNAVGPASPMNMAELLYGIRSVTSVEVSFTWVPVDLLREFQVGAWMEMPVWLYPSPEMAGFTTWDASKAMAAGLTFRPLADTARDTLEWWKSGPGLERELRTGVAPEKEAAILEAYHARYG